MRQWCFVVKYIIPLNSCDRVTKIKQRCGARTRQTSMTIDEGERLHRNAASYRVVALDLYAELDRKMPTARSCETAVAFPTLTSSSTPQ